jgi:hypothetical protein
MLQQMKAGNCFGFVFSDLGVSFDDSRATSAKFICPPSCQYLYSLVLTDLAQPSTAVHYMPFENRVNIRIWLSLGEQAQQNVANALFTDLGPILERT